MSPHSAPGPSDLRFSHLQEALNDELAEDVVNFARLMFSSTHLPDLFWTLHTAANLSTLRANARPVAYGDVLRWTIGATFCHQHGPQLADYFEP